MHDGGTGSEPGLRFSADGVHLLRTTQQIQYQLSQMADQKANMLLGITFVIFTLSLSQMRSGDRPLPLMVLGGAAFIAAVLAVLAVIPSVKPPPRPDAVANILFFGAFASIPEKDYVERMLGLLADERQVYEAFARDIHQNGSVLSRKKYRLLGYAYRVLLVGLVMSLAAFLAPMVLGVLRR